MLQYIYKEAASETVLLTLDKLTNCPLLKDFRLAGGTGLSFQLGHRISEDIDLFTDADYGSINFMEIAAWLESNFNYFDCNDKTGKGFGIFSFVGNSENKSIKLDLLYHDNFINPPVIYNNIKFAKLPDIAAMKLEVIANAGRKKDFWDLSALLDKYSLEETFTFYKAMYPYNDINNVISSLSDFERADEDEDPICLMNKAWELIKIDINEAVDKLIL